MRLKGNKRNSGIGFFVALIVLFQLSTFSSISSARVLDAYTQQLKSDYELLIKTAHSGQQQTFLRLAQRHENHPLLAYAQAEYLATTLDINKKAVINQFIEHYEGAPFVKKLERKWHHYLAANSYKKAFQNVYRMGSNSALDCAALKWYLKDGFSLNTMHEDLKQVWLTAESLPNECDALLTQWKASGLLNDDLIMERLSLASMSGNDKLARYLKKQLSAPKKYLARQWLEVAKRPSNVFKNNFFVLFNEAELNILKSVSRKLVFANPARFYTWWNDKAKPQFSNLKVKSTNVIDQLGVIDKHVAIALAVNEAPISLKLLNALPVDVVDDSVKQWRIARSLASNDWRLVLDSMETLPEQFQVDPAVVYWKAKAKLQLGETDSANQILEELAERRDYYGFLAAESIQKQPQIRHEPIETEAKLVYQVSKNATFQRAMTLFDFGHHLSARKEWNHLETQISDEQLIMAANLAADRGWHDRPIFVLAQLGYLNDVSLRFPLAYKKIIDKAAKRAKLPASLFFAIARRESSFISDASSSAGAAGLMQLKPSTASDVAKTRITQRELFEPALNVQLAGKYLARLKKQTNDNPVLMAASYNAGFSNVKSWLPKESVASDEWIESIPYHETRNYVKAVVAYERVYDAILNTTDETQNSFGNITNLHVQPEI